MTSSFFSSLYSSSIFQSIPLRNFIQRYSHTSNKTMIGQVALFAGWILLLNAIDFSSTSPSSGLLPIKMLAQAQSDASAASKTSLPVGLMNLRNTCYMNAILQGLFSVKQFSLALTLQAYKFKRDSVGEEMTTLFQQMQPDPSIRRRFPIRPSTLAQKLKIDINIQEDAEELLLKILNAVDESLLEGKKKKKKNKADSANNLDISPPASSATDASSQKCTPATVDPETIDPLPSAAMKFDLQQTITCVHHKHPSSEKLLEHFDLSIPFQGCKGFTEAIDQYFIPEMLTGENQYKCSVHGLQDAEKALKMATFPRVLIAHLKRFSFDPNTYQMKKIVDELDIPLTLDLRKHAANGKLPSDPTAGKYNLQVVVVHEGSLDYGHYYTFAKVPIDNELCNLEKQHWIKLNDHEVTVVDEATVLETARGGASKAQPSRLNNMLQKKLGSNSVSTNAYILFYTQQD